jgi:hypothetical protein
MATSISTAAQVPMQVSARRAKVNTVPAALAVLTVNARLVIALLQIAVVEAIIYLAAQLRVLARAKCAHLLTRMG